MRVVTANLWNGRVLPEGATELIEKTRPDVLAVQELVPEVAQAMAASFQHSHFELADEGPSLGVATSEPAEFARLPLASHQAIVARMGLFEVVNVHMPSPQSIPPWVTFPRRAADVEGLNSYMAQRPGGMLLVGDLNSTPAWPAYRSLTRSLDDAVVVAANGAMPARTWGPTAGSPRLLRIDHVLSRGLRPVHTEVVAVLGSDHSAVVVDFDLPSPLL